MAEKSVNVLGREVKMLYCAATEQSYEVLTGESVLGAKFDTERALVLLALAAIITAAQRAGTEPGLSVEEVLYEARPKDIEVLIGTVIELRREWYEIPAVAAVPEAEVAEGEKDGTDDGPRGQD